MYMYVRWRYLGEKDRVYLLNSRGLTRHLIEIPCKFHAYFPPHTVASRGSPPMPVIFAIANAETRGRPVVTTVDPAKVRITNVDGQRRL